MEYSEVCLFVNDRCDDVDEGLETGSGLGSLREDVTNDPLGADDDLECGLDHAAMNALLEFVSLLSVAKLVQQNCAASKLFHVAVRACSNCCTRS